ncbi:hypothetical protein ACIQRH_01420 [Pseudomonas sp. NPDC090964]|uniref:hypothetical protein n=1 Tax=Pseudomonas sp. NPDC090964 TaxID=3364482 RepID=UPI003821D278
MKRKFLTEYAICYMNSLTGIITADQLMSGGTLPAEEEQRLSSCHIYAIAARPSVRYKPDSIRHENNKFSGVLVYKVSGKEYEFGSYDWELEDGASKLECPYPYLEINAVTSAGEITTHMPANVMAMLRARSETQRHDLNTFQVLYIGQAIGDGSRCAVDRLTSHSTLQRILARVPYDHPDQEIVLFMYEFDHTKIISSMDGRAVGAIANDENDARFANAVRNPPKKKQSVGMIEAALIRYFQPEYNDKFKLKFPSTKLKTLKSCYDLDISGLTVELDSSEVGVFMWSSSASISNHHTVSFDLVAPLKRTSFFDATGIKEMPGIIKAIL